MPDLADMRERIFAARPLDGAWEAKVGPGRLQDIDLLAQSLARTHPSPRDFLKAINRVVADNIDSKSFITMSYGVIDLDAKQMTFARAGHCPLIRVPGAAPAGLRRSEFISPDGLVLGLKIDDGATRAAGTPTPSSITTTCPTPSTSACSGPA